MFVRRAALLVCPLLLALPSIAPSTAEARGPTPGYHPWAQEHVGPLRVDASDMVAHPERYIDARVEQPDFHALDDFAADPQAAAEPAAPGGWAQHGGVVMPGPVANGEWEVDPDVAYGMQVIPGNEYPRKHTLFINFNGGMLYSGSDNSAENRSTLARQGVYPTYEGGEQKALAIIEAIEQDVAPYGIVVRYLDRPPKVVPYTMEMVGGQWTDTNIDSPAGGVAPGADCGALGQRHVVYTFASGGQTATLAANTASQEAGHAWGLDHTFNCDSVMSYCGITNGGFSTTCDTLCETQCQGPNSAGCRLTHEEFCGVGSDQQNEDATLVWLFGGNEPDMEAPVVEIVEPPDGLEVEAGADLDVRSIVSDNYGGYSWYYTITANDEVVGDFVDYDRQIDLDYRPALNLAGVTEGVWVITVGTEDHYGNTAEDTVTVYVGVPNDSSAVDDSSGGDDMGTGPLGTGGDDEQTDGDDDPGIDDGDVGSRGCACGVGPQPTPGPSGAGLLLLGLWAIRRRR